MKPYSHPGIAKKWLRTGQFAAQLRNALASTWKPSKHNQQKEIRNDRAIQVTDSNHRRFHKANHPK